MPTRLLLIAHAPTAATRRAAFADDEPIEPGASPPVVDERFQRLYVAPELRARQSLALLGWTAQSEPALRDFDGGAWRGRRFDDLMQERPEMLAAWTADPDMAPPGGESVRDLVARLSPWLDLQRQTGGRVAAVTHPAILRAAAITALETPMALFWRIDAGPLAQMELRSDGRRWTLRRLTQQA